jgi:hypothetical protein
MLLEAVRSRVDAEKVFIHGTAAEVIISMMKMTIDNSISVKPRA